MSRPKKTWAIPAAQVAKQEQLAIDKTPINDRKTVLPITYVRVIVDGTAYFVPGFREEDWESIQ